MTLSERLKATRGFFEGRGYILFSAILIFLGHSTLFIGTAPLFGEYQEFIFGGILVLSMCLGCFACEDLRFMIMPVISFIFLVPVEHSPNVPYHSRFYIQLLPLALTVLLGLLLIACICRFIICNRHRAKRVAFAKPIFLGMAVLCGGLLLNGAFSSFYTFSDTLYPVSFLLSLLAIYALFAAFTRFDATSFDHFMTCLLATGLLICAELLWAYVSGGIRFENGSVVKESVLLGWGVWTAIGGMLAFLMPACFYFAHSHKHGWIYYLLGLLEYACIFLSQSRGGLLIGTGVLGLCVICLCINGKNRKLNRILTVSLAVVGVCGVALLFDRLMSVLQNYLSFGMDDNGRFDKWGKGWKNFTAYPIFGAGFYKSFVNEDWPKEVYPYLYHNTLIQLLGSGGLVAFGSYVYHRITTVMLVCKRPNVFKLFLAFGILGLLIFSLLDVLFFNTYPTIIYALMLLFMEKSEEHFGGRQAMAERKE